MNETTCIELYREDMKFSAGHFTIFSETDRERLHGHNFRVHAEIEATLKQMDFSVDYTCYRKAIIALCRELNEVFLLPEHSPFIQYTYPSDDHIGVCFNQKEMTLLREDVKLLPLENITTEGLARWMTEALMTREDLPDRALLSRITMKISSGPGQTASYTWISCKGKELI